jgi:N-acetylglucosaminyl-diphospho-decaprenol L-rhamnosyltransferase
MLQLAVVILNYKTPKLVVDALHSLEGNIDPSEHTVVVVDNASGDESVELITQAITEYSWGNWASVIPSSLNGGFSAGNNIGIKAIDAEYYLLLNSDTLVRPKAIKKLLNAAKEYPEAGIISPRLEWPDSTPQISCFRYHSLVSELIDAAATGPITSLLARFVVWEEVSDDITEVEWTSFACVLIRRQVIKEVGLMDEGYFMYYDDVDYCRRTRNKGWKIINYPEARVVHLRGGSGSVKADIAQRKRPRSYLYESRSRYFAKFYGPMGITLANLMWLLGRSIAALREVVGNKTPHTCIHAEFDIWTNWLHPFKPSSMSSERNLKSSVELSLEHKN